MVSTVLSTSRALLNVGMYSRVVSRSSGLLHSRHLHPHSTRNSTCRHLVVGRSQQQQQQWISKFADGRGARAHLSSSTAVDSSIGNKPSVSPSSEDDVSDNEKKKIEPSTMATLRRIAELAKPERPLILASMGTLVVTSSISLVFPYALGEWWHVLLSGDEWV